MISEMKTRAWLVSAAPPAKQQYYSGQVDGSSCFHCDWKRGIPLTHSEALQIVKELEHTFFHRAEKYEPVWLGDVAEFRPTFSLITGQHFIRIC